LLFVSAAFLAWYALAGGETSVQRTVDLLLARTREGQVAAEAAHSAPEYGLATRTMHVDQLAPGDPLVLQFKAILDTLAPKCKESRSQLATAAINAHDAMSNRGIDVPYLSILAQTDTSLSEQTRSLWPTNCQDVITRLSGDRRGP